MERRERLKKLIAEREGQLDMLDLPTANDQMVVEEVQVQKVSRAREVPLP